MTACRRTSARDYVQWLSYEVATEAVSSNRSRSPNVRSRLEYCPSSDLLCAVNLRFPLPGERATAVAIYRVLQKSAFGPDDIERLAMAYERALRVLKLNDRNDPITEIVARRIIEAAQTSLRDPDSLCATAIKDLRVP